MDTKTKDFIKRAKKIHGNIYDYSKVKYLGTKSDVTIVCPKHGAFTQLAGGHLAGYGCAACGHEKRATRRKQDAAESFVKKARKVHGKRYDYSKVEYVNAVTPVTIGCTVHGYFLQTPSVHLTGCGCTKCAGRLVDGLASFVTKAQQVHGLKYDYRDVEYVNNSTKVKIHCQVHGVFYQTPSNHLDGAGCKKCAVAYTATTLTMNTAEFVKKARQVHGNTYDYRSTEYRKNGQKVRIRCRTHGIFETTPSNHLAGHHCPRCSGFETLNTEDFIKNARNVHGDRYDYSKVDYAGSQVDVEIVCPTHGSFWQQPNGHLAKASNCPKCVNTSRISANETALVEYLTAEGFKVEQSNRTVLPDAKELDIYIPSHKLAIEVNGMYWHSEVCGKSPSYHYDKTVNAKRAGVRLLHFWDSEVSSKTELVQSMISQRLGISKRLYARKLVVVEVDKAEAKAFLDAHHLQGSSACSVAYGLRTKKGRLAAVMTFGKPYINQNYEWEIKRFATHQGLTVVGGASRLWSAFIRAVNPKAVLTYADLRFSAGGVYRQLGFSLLRRTKPNYVWVRGSTVYTRYQAQKGKLQGLLGKEFDPKESEKTNMEKAGYTRVFDCGNLVFEYVRS